MKKASQVLFFGAFLSSSLQGFEAKLNGFVDQSSTIGFNQHKINKERGIYPNAAIRNDCGLFRAWF